MDKIASKLVNDLVSLAVIDRRDIDIYRYGLEVLLLSLLQIFSILFIAFFVGNFFETVVYFAAFIPMRLFAGGYHASTRSRCYLLSLFVYGIFTIILKICPNYIHLELGLSFACISLVAIFFLAPEIHSNRKFDQTDYLFFKRVCKRIEIIGTFVIIICYLFQKENIVFIISISLLSEIIAILASKISNIKVKII